MQRHSSYAAASAPGLGGPTARLVQAASLTAALAGGTACSAITGYDNITYESGTGDTTTGDHLPFDPQCYPQKAEGHIRADCGVFASTAQGNDQSGDGSQLKPFRTLARALEAGKTIYACNDGPFEEPLAVDAEVSLFGGVDCEHDWAYSPDRRTIWQAPAGVVPLSVHSQASMLLCDFALVAASAMVPGGSSIAIIASPSAKLEMQRCSVTAGAGMDAPPAEAALSAGVDGASGAKGNAGCMSSTTDPGVGGELACEGMDVSGGAGGSGLEGSAGGDGTDGSPASGMGNDGIGGKRQDATACSSGSAGLKGETTAAPESPVTAAGAAAEARCAGAPRPARAAAEAAPEGAADRAEKGVARAGRALES